MDGSRVVQSLDSLWFYTNIFTCRDEPVASLVGEFSPLVHHKECPERDMQKAITPFVMNQQHESQNKENLGQRCHKFGGIPLAFEEVVAMVPSRETKKRGRRKRRKWNKLGSWECLMHDNNQQQTKMPPFDDDVAMKQHLKSWAYAVACSVR